MSWINPWTWNSETGGPITGGMEYWHQREVGQAHESIWATVDAIVDEQSALRDRWCTQASFYLNRKVSETAHHFIDLNLGETGIYADEGEQVSWNICRAIPDALVSVLTLNEPTPRVMTENAPEMVQSQAKKRERFIAANLRASGFYEVWRHALRQGCIFGAGFGKFYPRGGQIGAMPLRPDQVVLDTKSLMPGVNPCQMGHRDLIERGYLAELVKKDDDALGVLGATQSVEGISGGAKVRDQVEFCEIWKTTEAGTKGRHCIVTRSGTLVDEVYNFEQSPIFTFKIGEPLSGFYPQSLIDHVEGCQREINYTLREIRGNQRHLGVAHLFVDKRSKLKDADFEDTTRYKIVEGFGDCKVQVPDFASEQQFKWALLNWAKAFEQVGLNELMAHAAKPPGLESGAALREYREAGSRRFSEISKRSEQCVVDAAQIELDLGKHMYKGSKWTVTAESDEFLESINWDEVDGSDHLFNMSVRPASSLPLDPAGRTAELERQMNGGLIDRQEARAQMANPDLAKSDSINNAPFDDLESTFEYMLATGDYVEPEVLQDVELGKRMGLRYRARARKRLTLAKHSKKDTAADKKQVEIMTTWLNDLQMLVNPAPPPPPPISEALPADPAAAAQLAQAQAATGGPAEPPQGMPPEMPGAPPMPGNGGGGPPMGPDMGPGGPV